uniref:Uncharacterized protein n=1 Tax=Opuntia streptacantha TaxID=393608 RepID=A0A7C9CS44_OPUST
MRNLVSDVMFLSCEVIRDAMGNGLNKHLNNEKLKRLKSIWLIYESRRSLVCPNFNSEALQVLKLRSLNQCVLVHSNYANMCLLIVNIIHIWVYPLHWYPKLLDNFILDAPRSGEALHGADMPCSTEYGYGF